MSAALSGTRGYSETQIVTFSCDASNEAVPAAIYIVGNTEELGDWVPNAIRMYDDCTHGDVAVGDGIWSLQLVIPDGEKIEYMYTNGGARGGGSRERSFQHVIVLSQLRRNQAT